MAGGEVIDSVTGGPFQPKGDRKTGAVFVTDLPAGLAPAAGTNAAIAVDGTAVALVTGPVRGGYLINPKTAAAQGVAVENAYVDPVAAPGSTDAGAHGTTVALEPGDRYDFPALAAGAVIRGNAASAGHKLIVVVYP